jgi:predicted RNA-binding protein with PUA-like domain
MAKKSTKKTTTQPKKRASDKQRFWLLKSEPEVFSIDDLEKSKHQTTYWDGVRNYQARNFLRDEMKLGDLVLFYHSNAKPPGIAGVAKVVREGYPDHTAFDKNDEHFDPKSKPEDPTWYMVDVQLVEKFDQPLSLPELRELPALSKMALLQRGSRLSVQPVSPNEFKTITDRKKK